MTIERFYSYDTEIAVLGLVINNENAANKIFGYLNENHFFDKMNQNSFSILKQLNESEVKINIDTINNLLQNKKLDSNLELVKHFPKIIASAGVYKNLDSYLEILRKNFSIRNLKKELENSLTKINSPVDDFNNLVDEIETKIISISQDRQYKDFQSFDLIIEAYRNKLNKIRSGENVEGVSTGFNALDEMTNGFNPGDLIILAARPGMGKTALGINFAINIAKEKDGCVAFFSLEMPAEQITQRVLSIESNIPGSFLRRPTELNEMNLKKMNWAMDKVKEYDLFIDDTPGIKLSELIWKTKKLAQNKNLKLVLIDYLQLIVTNKTGDNRQQEVAEVSRKLKQLAREVNVPVIAIAQLSRRVESREDKRPLMSDIRESGAIEQDADLISFLYREAYYKKDNFDDTNHCELIIAKHRHGPTGIVDLNLHVKTGFFDSFKK